MFGTSSYILACSFVAVTSFILCVYRGRTHCYIFIKVIEMHMIVLQYHRSLAEEATESKGGHFAKLK